MAASKDYGKKRPYEPVYLEVVKAMMAHLSCMERVGLEGCWETPSRPRKGRIRTERWSADTAEIQYNGKWHFGRCNE